MDADRWLRLEGADNVRDVGGLPVIGGGRTRSGVLLRSATLRDLTVADVEHLTTKFGLQTVIDLRTPREIERDGPSPLAVAGVRTAALTLIGEDRPPLPQTDDVDPLTHIYLAYLEDRGDHVVEAIRLLAEPDGLPALVHCAAGKDRTGVLVAVVLDAIGVEREAVVADYGLSSESVEAVVRRYLNAAADADIGDITRHMPRPAALAEVLAILDRRNGGGASWLRAEGLPQTAIDRLRDRLVD